MGNKPLSQAEVESLLGAGAAGAPHFSTRSASGQRPTSASGERTPSKPAPPAETEVVSQQLNFLRALHTRVARDFVAALSSFARQRIEVSLVRVQAQTYAQLVRGLASPTCFSVVGVDALLEHPLLNIELSILFPLIDRLLGGGQQADVIPQRPLSDIEMRLANRVTTLFLEQAQRAWASVCPLRFDVLRTQHDPRLVQVMSPSELLAVMDFEMSVGTARGTLRWCLPLRALERLGQLSATGMLVRPGGTAAGEYERLGGLLQQTTVSVVAELARTRITAVDLVGLRPGDIITTEQSINGPLVIAIEGVRKFWARPGAHQGHKAISIEGMIESRPAGQKPPAAQ